MKVEQCQLTGLAAAKYRADAADAADAYFDLVLP